MKDDLQGAFMGKSSEPAFLGDFRLAERESVGSKRNLDILTKNFHIYNIATNSQKLNVVYCLHVRNRKHFPCF